MADRPNNGPAFVRSPISIEMWHTNLWKSFENFSDLSTKGKKEQLRQVRDFSPQKNMLFYGTLSCLEPISSSLLPCIVKFCDLITWKP